jgi:hypothetical protein
MMSGVRTDPASSWRETSEPTPPARVPNSANAMSHQPMVERAAEAVPGGRSASIPVAAATPRPTATMATRLTREITPRPMTLPPSSCQGLRLVRRISTMRLDFSSTTPMAMYCTGVMSIMNMMMEMIRPVK